MYKSEKKIWIYADWDFLEAPQLIGQLTAQHIRGKEVFSFEYQDTWLKAKKRSHLDPNLLLYAGKQFLREEKQNFGLFSDSAPDRWGRMLIQRREAIHARAEKRSPNPLFESDYLLGVFDAQRMGGIRLKTEQLGPFQNADQAFAVPPLKTLSTLQYAAWQIESDSTGTETEQQKWLNTLLAPGASIGGARPKAGVVDNENHLWIAKFPSRSDTWDVAQWEKLVNILAHKASLQVAKSQLMKFQHKHHTFLSQRFDRTALGRRIHFASAMTMLGYTDGTDANDGASYLEIAEFLMQHGAAPQQDLFELWQRIVFNICVSNTDDHLRNHGFLLTPMGWRLSPAYDINPVPNSYGLKLNINAAENSLDLDLALETASYYRIKPSLAKETIQHIKSQVRTWEVEANALNITRQDLEVCRSAFSVCEK